MNLSNHIVPTPDDVPTLTELHQRFIDLARAAGEAVDELEYQRARFDYEWVEALQ